MQGLTRANMRTRAQLLGIGLLVGAQALGNLREQQAPQGGPLLLGMAAVSAVLLSTLCAAKWRLAVRRPPALGPLRPM